MLIGSYHDEAGVISGEQIEFDTNDIEFAVIQVETLTEFRRSIIGYHFAVLKFEHKRLVIGRE
jgi:hypothetical protein